MEPAKFFHSDISPVVKCKRKKLKETNILHHNIAVFTELHPVILVVLCPMSNQIFLLIIVECNSF